ncbi:hypothetical protein FOZ62_020173, partial [Perkinsus olseni]
PSIFAGRASKIVGFADLAGTAAKVVAGGNKSIMGGGRRKTWKSILQNKITPKKSIMPSGAQSKKAAGGGQNSSNGVLTDENDAFHEDLVTLVSNIMNQDEESKKQPPNVPAPRANHTATLVENSIVLFGGHGGQGYSRRPFNDVHVLNLDNDRWIELQCQGNPPAPRSGHGAFAKDGNLYIFGGWNNEQ